MAIPTRIIERVAKEGDISQALAQKDAEIKRLENNYNVAAENEQRLMFENKRLRDALASVMKRMGCSCGKHACEECSEAYKQAQTALAGKETT